MMCLYPIELRNGNVVPCGRCVVCVDNYRKMWVIRMISELSYCDYSKFVTLTYDDSKVPDGGSLRHSDVQLWLKRLRKELSHHDIRIKYYMCGEYGEIGNRPHYHVLLYYYVKDKLSDDVDLGKMIVDKWGHGYVKVGTVTPRSIRYCINYMDKMRNTHKAKTVKPYQRMSKGVGRMYYDDNYDRMCSLGYISHNGYKYDIPRYYKDRNDGYVKERLRERPMDDDYARRLVDICKDDLDRTIYNDLGDERNVDVVVKRKIYKAKADQMLCNKLKRRGMLGSIE